MRKYRFISDVAIAETCFEAYGQNLNLLFKHAALALEEVMVDTQSVNEKETKKLEVRGETLGDLLFRFLEEMVYLKDIEQLLFKTFNIQVINTKPLRLTAELKGEKIDPEKHRLRTDIKAVTYHLFEVKKEKNIWKARVVVDV